MKITIYKIEYRGSRIYSASRNLLARIIIALRWPKVGIEPSGYKIESKEKRIA